MAGYVSDVSFPSDDDEEVLEFLELPAQRPRVLRERPDYFEIYDDVDFIARFRLSKASVLMVLDLIVERLEFNHDRNYSLSPVNQLLLTLRFYATGCHLLTVGDFSGVSKSTACRVTSRVSTAIASLHEQFIKFPTTPEEIKTVQRAFYDIARFPQVVGAMDCTHIKIQSTGGNYAETFRNRKGFFSINVQTICSPDLKITDIVTRWPGSVHDSTIFNNCNRRALFETGQYGNALLLGDGGYGVRPFLLPPLERPMTPAEHRYNESQIRTRNPVERSYGVWKRRFPILALGMRLKLEKVLTIINACAVIHNISVTLGDPQPPDVIDDLQARIDEDQMPSAAAVGGAIVTNDNRTIRNAIIAEYFERLL